MIKKIEPKDNRDYRRRKKFVWFPSIYQEKNSFRHWKVWWETITVEEKRLRTLPNGSSEWGHGVIVFEDNELG